jgi:glutamate/tyrosine decarboxylase-like PLP-dependent enzyme
VEDTTPLRVAHEAALHYLSGVDGARVTASVSASDVAIALGGEFPAEGEAAEAVVSELCAAVAPGLVASTGPRYFGFVTGGALPAAVAAEWLASAWDQNAALQVMSPAMAAAEQVAGRWVLDALALPRHASVGFVTGATMANLVGLAAGRHRVLANVGWDVERDGLQGAPPIRLVCGAEAHASLFNAAQYLGLGRDTWTRVDVDDQGRMNAGHLQELLAAGDGPALVAAQAGNVNSGAFDPFDDVSAACEAHGAWLHVDGAFGLWVRASKRLRPLAHGAELAHSWAVDGHKWLNVPYDCGIAIVADTQAHRAAMSITAPYLLASTRDGMDWVPDASRRARGLTVYAALRQLGRQGLAALIERCCAHARRFADALAEAEGMTVLNEVVINQVVIAFDSPSGEDPADFRDRVVAAIQADGTCWAGATTWKDTPALRISVSNWRTTADDIDRSARAIVRSYFHARTTSRRDP